MAQSASDGPSPVWQVEAGAPGQKQNGGPEGTAVPVFSPVGFAIRTQS